MLSALSVLFSVLDLSKWHFIMHQRSVLIYWRNVYTLGLSKGRFTFDSQFPVFSNRLILAVDFFCNSQSSHFLPLLYCSSHGSHLLHHSPPFFNPSPGYFHSPVDSSRIKWQTSGVPPTSLSNGRQKLRPARL
jgi:hypothetical protein